MPFPVTSGAVTMCSFGVAPGTLNTLGAGVLAGPPVASILDIIPFVNVMPFAMCTSLANPAVAAATAAALGVLTPMPCTPVIPAPWKPGSPTVLVGGKPVLTNTSNCQCAFGGLITIVAPGQFTTTAP
ncbi:MAG: DUF4280 domain-containing protein [Acidimicrobiales bacterium]